MLLVVATALSVAFGESDSKEFNRLLSGQFTRRHQLSQPRPGFRSGIGPLCPRGGLWWFFPGLCCLGGGLLFRSILWRAGCIKNEVVAEQPAGILNL